MPSDPIALLLLETGLELARVESTLEAFRKKRPVLSDSWDAVELEALLAEPHPVYKRLSISRLRRELEALIQGLPPEGSSPDPIPSGRPPRHSQAPISLEADSPLHLEAAPENLRTRSEETEEAAQEFERRSSTVMDAPAFAKDWLMPARTDASSSAMSEGLEDEAATAEFASAEDEFKTGSETSVDEKPTGFFRRFFTTRKPKES